MGCGEEGAGAKVEDKNILLRQLTGRERENYIFWKSLLSQVTTPPQGVLSFTNACLSLHVHAHSLLSLGGVGWGSCPLLRRSPCLTGLFLPSGAMAGGGLSCEANPRPPPAAT